MRQKILRKVVRTSQDHHLDIDIPAEFGDHVEIIILPFNPNTQLATEEDSFNLAVYAAMVEDDEQEDAIWGKYVDN